MRIPNLGSIIDQIKHYAQMYETIEKLHIILKPLLFFNYQSRIISIRITFQAFNCIFHSHVLQYKLISMFYVILEVVYLLLLIYQLFDKIKINYNLIENLKYFRIHSIQTFHCSHIFEILLYQNFKESFITLMLMEVSRF
jgi:hypothetical protein